jgi:hypothetical protein
MKKNLINVSYISRISFYIVDSLHKSRDWFNLCVYVCNNQFIIGVSNASMYFKNERLLRNICLVLTFFILTL